MRRTSSVVSKKESQTGETQRLGLLGRKTSDEYKRRNSTEGGSLKWGMLRQAESQANRNLHFTKSASTIVFATPSKPRTANSVFGPRIPSYHPTPIQEEPSTEERPRPSFIAETPVGHKRIVDIPLSASESVYEDEDDDPLGDLMVMTDEEEEEYAEQPLVPDTPAR